MKTEREIINGREFIHYVSEHGGKIKCVETNELFTIVCIPADSEYTFEELTNTEISDSEALKIITEGE